MELGERRARIRHQPGQLCVHVSHGGSHRRILGERAEDQPLEHWIEIAAS
jgi:hypothetical protein